MAVTKEILRDEACKGFFGAAIGRFNIRCCAVGEFFVYENKQMLFNTYLVGFESFDQAYEALFDYLKARVR